MKKAQFLRLLVIVAFFLADCSLQAQHINELTANLDGESHQIEIKQKFHYVNSTNTTLRALYFYDWNNAYANNTTPLSKRFGEDFNRSLHLAKNKERGFTIITSIVDDSYGGLHWERTSGQDIIKINLIMHGSID